MTDVETYTKNGTRYYVGVYGNTPEGQIFFAGDDVVDISDPVETVGFLFLGGPELPAPGAKSHGFDLTGSVGCERYDPAEAALGASGGGWLPPWAAASPRCTGSHGMTCPRAAAAAWSR